MTGPIAGLILLGAMAISTVEEFRQRILDGVVDDIDELPRGVEVAWFNDPVTNRPMKFQQNQTHPFDPYSRVVGIFQTEDVIRVYTMASAPPDPRPPEWPLRPPSRYTLTRTAPTYVAEILSLEAMADAIADEWNVIAEATDTAADELDSVIEYLTSQDTLIERDKLIAALKEGEHRLELEPTDGVSPPAAATPPTPAAQQPS